MARADQGLHLCGLHLTMPLGEPPEDADGEVLSDADRRGLEDWEAHQANGTVVHVPINSTRPHTLAFALNDSPAGLAAWLVDKYRSYSDCDGDVENSFTKDELLAEITTYWVTGTIASGVAAVLRASPRAEPHPVPAATRRGPDRLRHLPSRCTPSTQTVGRALLQHPAVGGNALRGTLRRVGGAGASRLRASRLLPPSALTAGLSTRARRRWPLALASASMAR